MAMNTTVSTEPQNCESPTYEFLKAPKIPLKEKKKTHYRCYTFQQIKMLKPEALQGDRYARIVGFFSDVDNIYYLNASKLTNTQTVKIVLDSNVFIEPNSFIEVFGKIYFEKQQVPVPYIKVYFYKEIEGSYKDYITLYQLRKEIQEMEEESTPIIIDLFKDQQIEQIDKYLKDSKAIRTKNLFADMTEIITMKELEYEGKNRLVDGLKQMLTKDVNERTKPPSLQNLEKFQEFLVGELNDLEVESDYLSILEGKINSSKNSNLLNAEDEQLLDVELGNFLDDMDFV